MFSTLSISLILVIYVRAGFIPFDDCGSTYTLNEVDVQGCDKWPCQFAIGSTRHVTFNLVAATTSKTLKQQVYLILNSIHSGVNVTPDDPCSAVNCPVYSNNNASFAATMSINSTLVPLPGELLWQIYNERDEKVMCMKTKVKLAYPDYRTIEEYL